MPEFKADRPPPEPLRCCIHGNDLQCPGAGRCSGYLAPSPAPRDPSQPSDASVQKAVGMLASETMSADERAVRVRKLAAEIDTANTKSASNAVVAKLAPVPVEPAESREFNEYVKFEHAALRKREDALRQREAELAKREAALLDAEKPAKG